MSIDKKQFERHLFKPESHFEILLRGHLWLESFINRILELHIVDSRYLDADRMAFRQKIDIAQAFGFIGEEDGRALRELNRLRNKLAHNVMAEPGQNETKALIGMLSGAPRAIFDAATKTPAVIAQFKESDLAPLRYWFFAYATHFDYVYSLQKYRDENETKLLQLAAVQVARQMSGSAEIPIDELRRQFDLEDPPDPQAIWR
jgi:hypothetical protein